MAELSIDAMVRTQRIIFAALFSSVGIYGVVAWYLLQQDGPVTPLPPAVVYGISGAALAVCMVVPLLRRRILPPDGSGQAGVGRLASAQIVSWALCESIAVMGLVLVLLTRQMIWFYALGALSAASLFLYRPSEEQIRRVLGPSS